MQIDARGKRLVIRWKFEGKPCSLSFAGCNNPLGRLRVEQKAREIELDIKAGYFDRTLLKYRPAKLGKNPTLITAIELFRKYIESQVREGTIQQGSINRLNAIAGKLQKFIGDIPAQKFTESMAKDAIAQWSETASNRTIKTYLYFLKGAWNWAKGKYHIPEVNPWSSSLDRSRSSSTTPQRQNLDRPFTITELGEIIGAFDRHPHYHHYRDFVSFLVGTGCRFGEAVALRWENLGVNYSTAWICSSISRGVSNKKGTKTGKSRLVRLSPQLQAMLEDRFKNTNPQPRDLIFPSPTGIPINDHRFRERAWKTILESCDIEWKTPYQVRHAAISHALANGANPVDLAEQTGHSVRVLLEVYAHAIESKCLFIEVGAK
jgi:integrase